MKIRGIRVDTLKESQLLPVLPTLIECWKLNGGGDVGLRLENIFVARVFMDISTGLFLLALLGSHDLVKNLFAANLAFACTLFFMLSCVCLVIVLTTLYADRCVASFARCVNRLDELLIAHNLVGGIATLPHFVNEILSQVKVLIRQRVVEIRLKEEIEGTEDREIELARLREEMRELARLLKRHFGLDVGDFGPMFTEAGKFLAKKQAEESQTAKSSLK